jgi:hygromycin-B 7''-O-kinase
MTSNARTAYLPADVGWHNWGRFFTDVSLWRPVVKRIYRRTGISPAKQVETGFPGSCAVFVVDGQTVLKLFPPLFPADFAKEREVYHLLGERITALPRLLAEGVYLDQIEWPYLILEFRPGRAIREAYSAISTANKRSLARQLGQVIRQVHLTPLANALQFDTDPEAWRRFLQERRRACLRELRQESPLSERLLREVGPFLESIELLPEGFAPVLINADLTEDHLLLVRDGTNWRISALIDWADAEVGAPEYEWVTYWFSLCRQDKEMFKETLRAYDPALVLDDEFRRRMLAYTFLHRFGAGILAYLLGDSCSARSLAQLLDQLWPAY